MKSENTSKGIELFVHIALGAAIGIVVTFIVMLLLAVILVAGNLGGSAAAPMADIALGIGALAAGYAAARMHRKNGWLTGLAAGMVLLLLFVLFGLILGTDITSVFIIRIAVCAAASALGGIIGVNKKEKRKIN